MRAFNMQKLEDLPDQELDATISGDWSNGGFGLSRDRPKSRQADQLLTGGTLLQKGEANG